jgi:hypothetical protein
MMVSEQLHGTVERGAVMTESHLQKVICKAVCVALLISGDLEAAENAVADAIQSLDSEDLNTDALFICVSTLSINRARDAADLSVLIEHGEPSFALPPELQNVLYLPQLPRFCFVLRFLLRLPVSTSACLLQLETDQVIDYSSAAVSILGAITTREVSHDQLSCLPALSA